MVSKTMRRSSFGSVTPFAARPNGRLAERDLQFFALRIASVHMGVQS